MATEFTHEPDAHRYTMHVDGELVSVAEYLDHGAGLVFNHTITIPRFRGRGYADQLVDLRDGRRREHAARDRSRPTCWYVAEWFDRHPERAGAAGWPGSASDASCHRGLCPDRRLPHGRARRDGRQHRLALPAPIRLGVDVRGLARRRRARPLAHRPGRRAPLHLSALRRATPSCSSPAGRPRPARSRSST